MNGQVEPLLADRQLVCWPALAGRARKCLMGRPVALVEKSQGASNAHQEARADSTCHREPGPATVAAIIADSRAPKQASGEFFRCQQTCAEASCKIKFEVPRKARKESFEDFEEFENRHRGEGRV